MAYLCSCCGKEHQGLPHVAYQLPDLIAAMSGEERASRTKISEEYCIVDDEHYFVKGVLELPILDDAEPWTLAVWVSHKKENFLKAVAFEGGPPPGPFFGWLGNQIPAYDLSTLSLKTMAHYSDPTQRPKIKVDEGHQLHLDQHGIKLERAWDLAHRCLPSL